MRSAIIVTPIIAVIVGFILTGLIGNRILQHWQLKSWIRQQNLLGYEKEYIALKIVAEEISGAMGKRIYHMKRLLLTINNPDKEKLEERVKNYEETMVFWNENLSAFYTKLHIYAGYPYSVRLENEIQTLFSSTGMEIERLVKNRRSDILATSAELRKSSANLEKLQGLSRNYSRDLILHVDNDRKNIYFGKIIHYRHENLECFSTWELFKALFISSVDRHAIVRAAQDPRFPR